MRSDGTATWTLCRETALHDADGSVRALLHRHSAYDDRRDLVESLRAHEEALADEISQKQLLQAVASTANDSATMAEVLVQCRDLVLLHDDWERARGFVPESPGSTTMVPFYTVRVGPRRGRGRPVRQDRARAGPTGSGRGSSVWDERRLTMAFPVMLDGDVYAVVAITSAPPLFRFELIESMAAQVAQQLARVAERERAQAQLAHARDEAMEASRLEVGVPGDDEPRDPDPDERRDRAHRPAAAHRPRRPSSGGSPSGVQVAGRAPARASSTTSSTSPRSRPGQLELEAVDFDRSRPSSSRRRALVRPGAPRARASSCRRPARRPARAALSGDPTRLAPGA